MNWNLYLNFLIAMLAIINPIGLVPLWSQLTGDTSAKIRLRLAAIIIGFGIVVLSLFLITGKFILNFFSIDVIVFKVAGGILLLITGIRMVDGSNTQLSDTDDGDGTPFQLAKARFRKIMVPMAIPTIVGPGSLTTVILFGSGLSGFMDYGVLSIVLIVSLLILFIILAVAPWLEEKIDPIIFNAITRLFGIIVTAIALQFILEGLGDAFPNWLNESSPVEDAEGKSASKN